jgi:preprotein translocase subunit SecB
MTEATAPKKQFAILKLYVKDVSFESPGTPHSLSYKQWAPKVDLNLTNTHTQVEGDTYEAVLSITVTVSHEDKTAFLIEIQQAGLFSIAGFDDQELKYLIGSQCMSILFPYARETISSLSANGGFPPLILAPVNFDALYQQHLQQNQAQQDEPEATH